MDDEYRKLSRRGAETGDHADLTRELRALMRVGMVPLWKVDLLSAIGYEPATTITGVKPSDPHYSMAFQKREANMIKFWRRAARHIPSAHLDYRFEFQFRAALAALHVIDIESMKSELPYWEDLQQGALQVIDVVSRIVVSDRPPAAVLSNSRFIGQRGMFVGMLGQMPISAVGPRSIAEAIIHLLWAVYSHYMTDNQTMSPEDSPGHRLPEVMRSCFTVYPVGTGIPFYQPVSNELIPWILGKRDPLQERVVNNT